MQAGEKGLDEAYNNAVERIEGQLQGFRELGMNLLLWIVFARRPLTVEELRHDLAVKVGISFFDTRNLHTVKDVVSSCAGLVTVDRDSNIIRLVHYTTQEYFQRNYWRGADIEARDRDGTALLLAIQRECDNVVRLLLDKGADLGLKMRMGIHR
ncbi:hypothetical protein TWF481_002370 [Arthrobotrys musiformis]|uniref:GPI inositol-deacylase winged helix domain-containing protein n=1 Tax=Arthrobotrys musiformis TaxID=47236 RepID=A0AAV9VZ27_9PEZI